MIVVNSANKSANRTTESFIVMKKMKVLGFKGVNIIS